MNITERSNLETATYYMIPTIWHDEKAKIIDTIKRLVVAMG